jgi:hypothetical protein
MFATDIFRNGRAVIILGEFEFHFLIIDDLEEKQPAKLADALSVAIDAYVLTHDVLDRLDDIADGHD